MDIVEQQMVEAQIAGDSGDASYGKPKPPKPKPKPKPKLKASWLLVIYLLWMTTLFAILLYLGSK